MTTFELEAKEQRQFEEEYERWCMEVELAKLKYRVEDNSETRNLVNQKD